MSINDCILFMSGICILTYTLGFILGFKAGKQQANLEQPIDDFLKEDKK